MRKYLIGLVVAAALVISGLKIYQYYQLTQPPYEVGECIEFASPEGIMMRIEITDNVQERQTSVVILRIDFFGEYIYRAGAVEYQELRAIAEEFNAKKVSCEENPK